MSVKAAQFTLLSFLALLLLVACASEAEVPDATAVVSAEISATATRAVSEIVSTVTPAPTATLLPADTPTATPTTGPPDAAALLREALSAERSIPHHVVTEARVTVTFDDDVIEVPMMMEGDIEPPQRAHYTWTTELFGESVSLQVIVLGTEHWARFDETNGWMPNPWESSETLVFYLVYLPPFMTFSEEVAGPSQVSDVAELMLVGAETVEGKDVYHLSGFVKASAYGYEDDGELAFDYWIGLDGRPVKSSITGELADPGSLWATPGMGVEVESTTSYSEFGKELAIGAPAFEPSDLPTMTPGELFVVNAPIDDPGQEFSVQRRAGEPIILLVDPEEGSDVFLWYYLFTGPGQPDSTSHNRFWGEFEPRVFEYTPPVDGEYVIGVGGGSYAAYLVNPEGLAIDGTVPEEGEQRMRVCVPAGEPLVVVLDWFPLIQPRLSLESPDGEHLFDFAKDGAGGVGPEGFIFQPETEAGDEPYPIIIVITAEEEAGVDYRLQLGPGGVALDGC